LFFGSPDNANPKTNRQGLKGSATKAAASTVDHSLQITNLPRNIEIIISPESEALILFIFLSDNNEKISKKALINKHLG